MDIEQNRSTEDTRNKDVSLQIYNIARSKQFNIKKAIAFVGRYTDRERMYQQLEEMSQKGGEVTFMTNLVMLIQHVLTELGGFSPEIDQRLRRVIIKIYQIRCEVEQLQGRGNEELENLNKLLEIMSNLIKFYAKVPRAGHSQVTDSACFEDITRFILSLYSSNTFKEAINDLFEANLLLKILEAHLLSSDLTEILETKVLTILKGFEQSKQNCNQIIEEILLNTYFKCLKVIKNSYESFRYNLSNVLPILSNKSKLRLLCELKVCELQYIRQIRCQSEAEFQFLSLVIQLSPSSQPEIMDQLSELWIENLFCLLNSGIEIDLCPMVNGFHENILVIIYTKISELIQTSSKQPQKQNLIVYIWSSLLLTDEMEVIVRQNRSILINLEVLLFKFERGILGLIESMISKDVCRFILAVFSKYYSLILKQNQCRNLNHQMIYLIIQQFPELLRESMILKESVPAQNTEMISLENYDLQFLSELAKRCLSNSNLQVSLSNLNVRVSKIFLKYLVDSNIVPLNALLDQNDIITYTIENDIELHLDKYQHILHQKFYNDLEKYLLLVSKRQMKNRYRKILNNCLLNLLMNELQEFSNRKLIKLSEKMLIYLIENLDILLQLAQELSIQPAEFFNALLSLLIRGLYYNIPLIVHYFLITVSTLKKVVCSDTVVGKQIELFHELIKFCKMYNSQKDYLLIGYASILLILYGLPYQSPRFRLNSNVSQILISNNYFLLTIIQLFERDSSFVDDLLSSRGGSKLQGEELFKRTFKKCLSVGLIRHLCYVLSCSQDYRVEVKLFNNLIQSLINNEILENSIQTMKPTSDKKRRNMWGEEDEQKPIQKQIKSSMHVPKNFMQPYLKEYDTFDEFIEYRQLEKSINSAFQSNDIENSTATPNYSRVHGKIRAIYHVR